MNAGRARLLVVLFCAGLVVWSAATRPGSLLPGTPPTLDPNHLYAADRPNALSPAVRYDPYRIYVPNNGGAGVSIIDPTDGKVLWMSGRYNSVVYAIDTTECHTIAKIPVGTQPHGLCVWPQPGRYSLGHTGILR